MSTRHIRLTIGGGLVIALVIALFALPLPQREAESPTSELKAVGTVPASWLSATPQPPPTQSHPKLTVYELAMEPGQICGDVWPNLNDKQATRVIGMYIDQDTKTAVILHDKPFILCVAESNGWPNLQSCRQAKVITHIVVFSNRDGMYVRRCLPFESN